MKTENREFLTINEFAELIGVHPNTVRNMIKSGRLSAFRTGASEKSSYRIARSETHRLSVVDLDKIVENIMKERRRK